MTSQCENNIQWFDANEINKNCLIKRLIKVQEQVAWKPTKVKQWNAPKNRQKCACNSSTPSLDHQMSLRRLQEFHPKEKKTIRLIIHCHLSKLQAVTTQIFASRSVPWPPWRLCLVRWKQNRTRKIVKKELPARGVDPHNSRSINRTGGTATRRAVDRNSSEYISFLCVCFCTSPPRKNEFLN